MDSDNSGKTSFVRSFVRLDLSLLGVISIEEFTEVCSFLGKHNGSHFDEKQIADLAASIDLDKNGVIDFNEFLEAFRIVDTRNGSNN